MATIHVSLTERQRRELEYHRQRAREHEDILEKPFCFEVTENPSQRWWNAYWQMFTCLKDMNLQGKRVLVVGCGFGDDALRLAKLGAEVHAFDISPESLSIARRLAKREGLAIAFREMPAENMKYPDDFFDCIVARDILHHVDIPRTLAEIRRVAKPGSLFLANEIYSHSFTDRIRHGSLVEKQLYPRMQRFIYGQEKPYITEDERKLNETEIRAIRQILDSFVVQKYFNFLVTRIIPDRFTNFSKFDRLLLALLKPLAPYLAGRVLFAGPIAK